MKASRLLLVVGLLLIMTVSILAVDNVTSKLNNEYNLTESKLEQAGITTNQVRTNLYNELESIDKLEDKFIEPGEYVKTLINLNVLNSKNATSLEAAYKKLRKPSNKGLRKKFVKGSKDIKNKIEGLLDTQKAHAAGDEEMTLSELEGYGDEEIEDIEEESEQKIKEFKKELNKLQEKFKELTAKLEEEKSELEEKKGELEEKKGELEEKKGELEEKKGELEEEKKEAIQNLTESIEKLKKSDKIDSKTVTKLKNKMSKWEKAIENKNVDEADELLLEMDEIIKKYLKDE